MKTIFFVRHGEAQANADGLLAGAKTSSPLTSLGKEQAKEIAAELKVKMIDLIISSPLERATHTAEIIAEIIGYRSEIKTNALFIERDFGSATNMPKTKGFLVLDSGTAIGAESIADFGKRANQAINWLKAQSANNILVVSHAGFGQMLGTIVEGGKPEDFLKYHNLTNTGMYQLVID